jgi:hypothetical protein
LRTLKTGGIPFTRGSLAHVLRNRFYIGEVVFKGEVLTWHRGEAHGDHTPFLAEAATRDIPLTRAAFRDGRIVADARFSAQRLEQVRRVLRSAF